MSKYRPDDDYEPISMWGYFGYEILFSIPVVGWIILIIKAVSARNVNVRNFARSYFCFLIIAIAVIIMILSVTGAAAILEN
ncbi:MAG: hypothetical protein ACI4LM_02720 [Anaerovoracaceae bacterium]|jgi:hypothetical protein